MKRLFIVSKNFTYIYNFNHKDVHIEIQKLAVRQHKNSIVLKIIFNIKYWYSCVIIKNKNNNFNTIPNLRSPSKPHWTFYQRLLPLTTPKRNHRTKKRGILKKKVESTTSTVDIPPKAQNLDPEVVR